MPPPAGRRSRGCSNRSCELGRGTRSAGPPGAAGPSGLSSRLKPKPWNALVGLSPDCTAPRWRAGSAVEFLGETTRALPGLRRTHGHGEEEERCEEHDDGRAAEERAWAFLDPEGSHPAPAGGTLVQRYRHRGKPYQQAGWNGRMTIRHACRNVKPGHATIGADGSDSACVRARFQSDRAASRPEDRRGDGTAIQLCLRSGPQGPLFQRQHARVATSRTTSACPSRSSTRRRDSWPTRGTAPRPACTRPPSIRASRSTPACST